VKTNKLRIEPHRVMLNFPRGGSIFWRVWIDDKLENDTAFPFEKTDSSANIVFDINYEWDDRNLYFEVRRVKNYVIWTNHLIENILFVFDWDEYRQICDKANELTKEARFHPISEVLQEISSGEIKQLLFNNFPRYADEVVIYRQPHDRYDTTGFLICRRVQKAIAESKEFKLCDVPAKTIALKLGLDMPEFIEAIWHVGRCENGFAVYFEEYPYFPAWLYSDNLSKVFEQEDFVKEL
jgi:hypothetical protein